MRENDLCALGHGDTGARASALAHEYKDRWRLCRF